jgi:hypothetical protein
MLMGVLNNQPSLQMYRRRMDLRLHLSNIRLALSALSLQSPVYDPFRL